MKTKLLTLFSVCIIFSSQAQQLNNNFSKTFARTGSYTSPLITNLKNGNLLVTRDTSAFEVDLATGDSLNRKSLSKAVTYPKCITSDGDYIYVGGYSKDGPSVSKSVVAKLNMQLDTVWTRSVVNSSFAEGVSSILIDGTDVYAAGSYQSSKLFISKLNADGDTLWNTHLPQSTFSNLSSIIKLQDGNFLASGNYDDYPIAFKFNPSGDTLWHYQENLFISFNKMSAFEKSGSEVVLLARNKLITLNSTTGSKNSEKSTGFIDFYDAIATGIDTVYLFGTHKDQQYNAKQYPVVEVRYLSLDSVKSYIFTDGIHPLVNNNYSRAVSLGGTKFAVAGHVRDSVNLTANEWNIVVSKFNDISNTVSTEKIKIAGTEKVFPNPTNGMLFFENEAFEITVSSLLGEHLLTFNGGKTSINISTLKAGSYFVTWKNNQKQLNQQIIIKQ